MYCKHKETQQTTIHNFNINPLTFLVMTPISINGINYNDPATRADLADKIVDYLLKEYERHIDYVSDSSYENAEVGEPFEAVSIDYDDGIYLDSPYDDIQASFEFWGVVDYYHSSRDYETNGYTEEMTLDEMQFVKLEILDCENNAFEEEYCKSILDRVNAQIEKAVQI